MEPGRLTLRVDFGCLYPSDLAPRSSGGHVHRHPAPLAQPHADVGSPPDPDGPGRPGRCPARHRRSCSGRRMSAPHTERRLMRGDEARVVAAFCAALEADGWDVTTEVDFVDVVARRDGATV